MFGHCLCFKGVGDHFSVLAHAHNEVHLDVAEAVSIKVHSPINRKVPHLV